MLTLGIETIVILLLIMGVVSAFGGYVVAQERQRRAGGGKTAAELRDELSEYKDSVNAHFQTTAGLLHDMTEQYRAVYEHMASGAQSLCDPETARTQIESLRAGLLPSDVPAAAAEADANPDQTAAKDATPDQTAATDANTDAEGADPVAHEDAAQSPAEPADDTEPGGTEDENVAVARESGPHDAPTERAETGESEPAAATPKDADAGAEERKP